MNKYYLILANRVNKGNLKTGYDLYNRTDVGDILPSLTASYGIIGRIGTTLIFEENEEDDNQS